MVVLYFQKCTSSHKFTPESFKVLQFQKLFKNFCFHRNQCKIKIMNDDAYDSRCLFSKNNFQLFIGNSFLSSSIFRCVRLPKLPFSMRRLLRANLHIENLKICSYRILYPSQSSKLSSRILFVSSHVSLIYALKFQYPQDLW